VDRFIQKDKGNHMQWSYSSLLLLSLLLGASYSYSMLRVIRAGKYSKSSCELRDIGQEKHGMQEKCNMQEKYDEREKRDRCTRNEREIQEILQDADEIPWKRSWRRITKLIEDGVRTVDIPTFHQEGHTVLSQSVRKNDPEAMCYLLKKGANPNTTLYNLEFDKPLFFAVSPVAASLLIKSGADVQVKNCCSRHKDYSMNGMDLLHASIGTITPDDRLFVYYLAQGLDPKSLNGRGGNLWDSFVMFSAMYLPEEKLYGRARTLHTFGIDPYHKNKNGKSAIDIVKEGIRKEKRICDKFSSLPDIETHEKIQRKLENILTIMESKKPLLLASNYSQE